MSGSLSQVKWSGNGTRPTTLPRSLLEFCGSVRVPYSCRLLYSTSMWCPSYTIPNGVSTSRSPPETSLPLWIRPGPSDLSEIHTPLPSPPREFVPGLLFLLVVFSCRHSSPASLYVAPSRRNPRFDLPRDTQVYRR